MRTLIGAMAMAPGLALAAVTHGYNADAALECAAADCSRGGLSVWLALLAGGVVVYLAMRR